MVKFLKTTEYPVKSPVADYRGYAYNAGIDGFIPENTSEFRAKLSERNSELRFQSAKDENDGHSYFDIETGTIYVAPGEDVCIPSVLYSKLEKNTMLLDLNKSGIATKKKLAVGACVIDVSYQGIIHYHVYNFSRDKWAELKCDEKVVQMVQVPVLSGMEVVENLNPEEFFEEKTDRAAKGFGEGTGLK